MTSKLTEKNDKATNPLAFIAQTPWIQLNVKGPDLAEGRRSKGNKTFSTHLGFI